MNPFIQLAVIGGLSLAAAAGTWMVKGPPTDPVVTCDPATIRPDEICLSQVSGNVLWIDARSRAEWEQRRVEGSVLWNLSPDEDQQVMEVETATRMLQTGLVVVYCGSKACDTSRQVADRARKLGLGPEVRVLYGGWDALKGSNRVK